MCAFALILQSERVFVDAAETATAKSRSVTVFSPSLRTQPRSRARFHAARENGLGHIIYSLFSRRLGRDESLILQLPSVPDDFSLPLLTSRLAFVYAIFTRCATRDSMPAKIKSLAIREHFFFFRIPILVHTRFRNDLYFIRKTLYSKLGKCLTNSHLIYYTFKNRILV